jgi:hypothetical protein
MKLKCITVVVLWVLFGGTAMAADVHEFIVLKFKDGISKSEQIESMRKLDKILSQFEGFKMREFFFSEADNRWVDHIVWTNMDFAIASEKALENPEAAAIFQKVDAKSTIFSRYEKIDKNK